MLIVEPEGDGDGPSNWIADSDRIDANSDFAEKR